MRDNVRIALHFFAFLVLISIWAVTYNAVRGAHPLPPRIPVHFDAAGNPNGWGSPGALWLMPGIGTMLYLLMTLVAQFPSAFNFPVRVTREIRPRLESVALSMIAWLRVETLCLLAWIQHLTIDFARKGRGSLAPWLLPLMLGVVFATILWHVRSMMRAGATPEA